MHEITYITDESHVKTQKILNIKGTEYFENLETVANEITGKWRAFNTYFDILDHYFREFQHPTNYCIAALGRKKTNNDKEGQIISIRLSFVEKAILMETAKALGLPANESSIKEK